MTPVALDLTAVDVPARTGRGTVALFGVTLGAGAVLMFVLEPMAAKMVLPYLGGAPAVWNTCVVFFQSMLLAGYFYAHAGPQWLGVRRHAVLHIVLLVISSVAVLRPFRIDAPPGDSNPIAWLLLTLLQTVGLPFFLVATGTPLLQEWFSKTRHRAARDPYFLYAASNFGSLAGLVMYPVLIEPLLPLRLQASYWAVAYLGFVILTAGCAVHLQRIGRVAADTRDIDGPAAVAGSDAKPSFVQRLRWLALSFAPSSLMLAVTTFISTDVAAVPLLWVVPLALYLLTFVLAFSSKPRYPRQMVDRGLPLLMLLLTLFLLFGVTGPLLAVVPIHLAVFFFAALACHQQLADDRPHTSHLTEFYLLVALGGVSGSLFNTLAAPLLFTRVIEYPAVLLMVCLLRQVREPLTGVPQAWRVVGPIVITLATTGLMLATSKIDSLPLRFGLLAFPAFMSLSLSRTRLPFAAAIGGMLVASFFQPDPSGRVLYAERTFFGTYKVHQDPTGGYRTLTHGTTLHGIQSVSETRRLEPLSYYHPTGPLGDVFRLSPTAAITQQVGVVGLGVGSVATYRKPGQVWTFFEIDPAVEGIARNRAYFSYLADCGEACRVITGDARQSLRVSPTQYGVLVLDAFSSDAIPLHLLTHEALDLYLSRLMPGGVLAFHISNRHLDLEPVLARLAAESGLLALVRRDHDGSRDVSGKRSSEWLIMARRPEDVGPLASQAQWEKAKYSASTDLWTDDFSNVVTLLLQSR